jgi:hypothetical protein
MKISNIRWECLNEKEALQKVWWIVRTTTWICAENPLIC